MPNKTHTDDEDMSMEEILASIRKYVTDDYSSKAPLEKEARHGDERENSGKAKPSSVKETSTQPTPAYQTSISEAYQRGTPDSYTSDSEDEVIDLTAPVSPFRTDRATEVSREATPSQPAHSRGREVSQESREPSPMADAPASFPSSNASSDTPKRAVHPDLYEVISEKIDDQPASFSAPSSPISSPDFLRKQPVQERQAGSTSSANDYSTRNTPMTDYNTSSRQPAHTSTAPSDKGNLASAETVAASASAFSRLAQAVKPATAPTAPSLDVSQPTPSSTNLIPHSSQTVDGLITSLARPMIKEWLDQNLPKVAENMTKEWVDQNLTKIVESMVEKELQKITQSMGG